MWPLRFSLSRQANVRFIGGWLLVLALANCQSNLNLKPSAEIKPGSSASVQNQASPAPANTASQSPVTHSPSVQPSTQPNSPVPMPTSVSAPVPVMQPSSPNSAPGPAWYQPPVNLRWQWQLSGNLNTSYDVDAYDVDLFDTPSATIQALHQQGKKVICYFSAGSWEDWRADHAEFPSAVLGKELDGWPGEKWLDIRSASVYKIMQKRLDLAKNKACDAVEPDNVDGYANNTGLGLSPADQLDYNRFLAKEAHLRGLGIGLKNDLDQVGELVQDFDFSVNEECHAYDECALLEPFIDAGKPVLNAEYESAYVKDLKQRQQLCQQSQALGLQTLILPLELDDQFRYACWES